MAAIPETCADHGECLIRKLGRCTNAEVLDSNTAYFDDPKLVKFFEQTGEKGFEQLVVNYADSKLDICQRPDELRAAAKRARARALAFFHPK